MHARTLGFWLCIATLLIASTGATLAQDGPPPRSGVAEVTVGLDSSWLSVQGVDSVMLEVTLQGKLTCRLGAPPAPLAASVIPEDGTNGLGLDLVPESFEVDWQHASSDAGQQHYEVNETAVVTASIVSPPQARVVMDFIVLLQAGGAKDDDARCSEQGYSIRQSDEPHVPLIVEPESGDGSMQKRTFNWIPLLVGVALLGAVATFAVWREKINER